MFIVSATAALFIPDENGRVKDAARVVSATSRATTMIATVRQSLIRAPATIKDIGAILNQQTTILVEKLDQIAQTQENQTEILAAMLAGQQNQSQILDLMQRTAVTSQQSLEVKLHTLVDTLVTSEESRTQAMLELTSALREQNELSRNLLRRTGAFYTKPGIDVEDPNPAA